jgi:hypothetical protein
MLMKRHDPDERRTGSGYHPQELAKAVTQSAKRPDHIRSVEQAKDWLLFSHAGRMLQAAHRDTSLDELAQHVHEAINGRATNKRDEDTMTNPNSAAGLLAVAKRRGATCEDLCRHVIKYGACDQTEQGFTDLLMMYTNAQKRAGESDASAFSRMFGGSDPAAVLMPPSAAVTSAISLQAVVPACADPPAPCPPQRHHQRGGRWRRHGSGGATLVAALGARSTSPRALPRGGCAQR